LIYKNWRVHFVQKGAYRIDADPPRLWVRQGQAEVAAGVNQQPVSVEQGMSLPFAGVLVPERASEPSKDALSDWSTGRGESITADNAITAQLDQDPAAAGTPGVDNFTYYPFLGLSSLGMSTVGPYSAYVPIQPGFSSIYLPGYTYRPLLLGTMGVPIGHRFPTYPLSLPRVVGAPGSGYANPLPRMPATRPGISRAPSSIGVHAVGHH